MGNDGGPAFPASAEQCNQHDAREGMSLRDYYAAKAMQALIDSDHMNRTVTQSGLEPWDAVGQIAYRYADAMLAEREKYDD